MTNFHYQFPGGYSKMEPTLAQITKVEQLCQNWVVCHPIFKNGKPRIGLVKMPHYRSIAYRDADVDIYFWYFYCGETISNRKPIKEFVEFLNQRRTNTLIHTSVNNAFCMNGLLFHHRLDHDIDFKLYATPSLPPSVGRSCKGPGDKNERIIQFIDKELANSTVKYLDPPDKLCWTKVFNQYLEPKSRAEVLHEKFSEYPDPIQWIKTGYETTESNEYTDYMRSYVFDDLIGKSKISINYHLLQI